MDSFSEWLRYELDRRGWKQSDLAKSANLDSAVISNLVNGKRGPGQDTCLAIAKAFNLPLETVYRAAGLLPDLPTPRDLYTEIVTFRLSTLTDDQLSEVMQFIEFIQSRDRNERRR